MFNTNERRKPLNILSWILNDFETSKKNLVNWNSGKFSFYKTLRIFFMPDLWAFSEISVFFGKIIKLIDINLLLACCSYTNLTQFLFCLNEWLTLKIEISILRVTYVLSARFQMKEIIIKIKFLWKHVVYTLLFSFLSLIFNYFVCFENFVQKFWILWWRFKKFSFSNWIRKFLITLKWDKDWFF